MIDLTEHQHEPLKRKASDRRPAGNTGPTQDRHRLVSTLETEVSRLTALETSLRAGLERERERGNHLSTELAAIREQLAAVTAERDAERARTGQVEALTATLAIERVRVTEWQAVADRWASQAERLSAPRPWWSFFRRVG
jgi:hypothetical protein